MGGVNFSLSTGPFQVLASEFQQGKLSSQDNVRKSGCQRALSELRAGCKHLRHRAAACQRQQCCRECGLVQPREYLSGALCTSSLPGLEWDSDGAGLSRRVPWSKSWGGQTRCQNLQSRDAAFILGPDVGMGLRKSHVGEVWPGAVTGSSKGAGPSAQTAAGAQAHCAAPSCGQGCAAPYSLAPTDSGAADHASPHGDCSDCLLCCKSAQPVEPRSGPLLGQGSTLVFLGL